MRPAARRSDRETGRQGDRETRRHKKKPVSAFSPSPCLLVWLLVAAENAGVAQAGGAAHELLGLGAAADVEFDLAEGGLVPLQRHGQGTAQPLGRVEVHDEPL